MGSVWPAARRGAELVMSKREYAEFILDYLLCVHFANCQLLIGASLSEPTCTSSTASESISEVTVVTSM